MSEAASAAEVRHEQPALMRLLYALGGVHRFTGIEYTYPPGA
jgi:hypothetical protein